MKVQQTPNLQTNNKNQTGQTSQNPNFKGGEIITSVLNYLETNQTIGATVVDAGCMGIPRSAVDFTRGSDAGIETMRREFSSTGNHVLIGAYGLGAAWLWARALNNEFGIKAHKIFASDENLDILSQIRAKHGDISNSDKNLSNYLKEIFENTKAFNPEFPDKSKIDENGWVNIDAKAQKDVIEKFSQELKNNPEKLSDKSIEYLRSVIADSTGSEKNFKLEYGKVKSSGSLKDLIENVYKVSKALMSNKVSDTFKGGNIADNSFVQGMKKLNKRTAALGLAIAMAVGVSVQPVNMYLTKRKTGKSGFVGVEGQEPDKSGGFKLLKGAIAIVGALAALKTIGKFKEIPSKLQFKGFLPTIDQFKLIYGTTIVSRILSARDKNELRETTTKDTLGFASWLILGGFVSKLTAFGFQSMDKFKNDKFIRYNEKENGTGWFNKLIKSSIVSREEVLHSALKKAGISTIKENGVAMSLKEMLQAAAKHAPEARTKIRYLGFIQFAGYLYSGLALGIGIPKLNIAITKHFQKKEKEAEVKK